MVANNSHWQELGQSLLFGKWFREIRRKDGFFALCKLLDNESVGVLHRKALAWEPREIREA
jgi:hypothetical protein